jgi:hypothetical protein
MAGKQDSMVASVKKLARLLIVVATSACASGALAAQPATISTAASESPSPTLDPSATTMDQASSDSKSVETDTPSDPSKTKWVFVSTPYVWMTGSKTKFTTRQGEEITSKDSFFDVLKDLKFALMGGSEARRQTRQFSAGASWTDPSER